jgi:hypothetical protein
MQRTAEATSGKPPRHTVFVVQPFEIKRRGRSMGLAPTPALAARDEAHARLLLERAPHRTGIVGAVAFSRSGDPESGDYDEPVILGKIGDVPDELI